MAGTAMGRHAMRGKSTAKNHQAASLLGLPSGKISLPPLWGKVSRRDVRGDKVVKRREHGAYSPANIARMPQTARHHLRIPPPPL